LSDLLLLCYHAVSERWPASLSVRPADFEAHISSLANRGYEGVTLREAITQPQPGRTVAITFDDAFRSVYKIARPILTAAGFKGSVFAPTSFIGGEQPMSWPGVEQWAVSEHRAELVPMSWTELAELAEAGWEIGSHTRTHARLPQLTRDELDDELQGSRTDIEEQLGRPCRSLAYPFGAHDARVVEAARRAGYETAAATLPGRLRPPTGSLDWPRIVINHPDSPARFRIKTSRATRRTKASRAWEAVAAARRGVRRVRGTARG
jgi:peptidoglycan/xylan/chitin deacetylase (PgdA/CDA1 family)